MIVIEWNFFLLVNLGENWDYFLSEWYWLNFIVVFVLSCKIYYNRLVVVICVVCDYVINVLLL